MRSFVRLVFAIFAGGLSLLTGCAVPEPVPDKESDALPSIFPDYAGVTIPANIAPLCFRLEHTAGDAVAVIGHGEEKIILEEGDNGFSIPEKKWRRLLDKSKNDSLSVRIYLHDGDAWTAYRPFSWHVSSDEVDPYLVYRLIEPGYELWNKMGIYQRDLTTFHQEAVLTNDKTQHNCMNCHSFNKQNPDTLLFHMRAKLGGTYLAAPGKIDRLYARVKGENQSLVYPSWHPSGRFIAFSVNQTRQAFHLNDKNRIEVFDMSSDVVVYDLERHETLTDSLLFSPKAFETFPAFSPDGKTLYFCSAAAKMLPGDFDQVKYSLCSVTFDPAARRFGTEIDTLYNAEKEGNSVSFPRVSPDGKYIVFTVSGYGNFSIWHKDADLYLYDIARKEYRALASVNSDDVESYHSWSSNGRWMVFSSRRIDGLYTHPYLVHVDTDGNFGKPFVVPQSDPDFYQNFMYSFNIPELIKGKVELDAREVVAAAR